MTTSFGICSTSQLSQLHSTCKNRSFELHWRCASRFMQDLVGPRTESKRPKLRMRLATHF